VLVAAQAGTVGDVAENGRAAAIAKELRMTGTAAGQSRQLVKAVEDDPSARLALAAHFYDDQPARDSIRSYRRAELAFMRWQVRRGVLAPLQGSRPGSRWWRAVNDGLLRDAWEADRLLAGAPGPASRPAVGRWVQFLQGPSPQSWYRAHNASIVAGYLEHRQLSEHELPAERFFMDVALGRVLFVHVLVTRPRSAVGRWLWRAGPLLGDPRWRGADIYLSVRNVLPDRYPLTGLTIAGILAAENPLARLIDYGVMIPRAQELYELAAEDLDEPGLLDFISDGSLVYAWPFEDRHVWVPAKSRALIKSVTRLTSG
jgi:hypothetical protein